MKIQDSSYLSSLQIQEQLLNQSKSKSTTNNQKETMSFKDLLLQKANLETAQQSTELKFSKHAMARLNDRNIELSTEQLKRLENATEKAGEKGIQDSLVLMDDYAFIVNVPSSTVVTAMDQNENQQNIFTNIDGAVIV